MASTPSISYLRRAAQLGLMGAYMAAARWITFGWITFGWDTFGNVSLISVVALLFVIAYFLPFSVIDVIFSFCLLSSFLLLVTVASDKRVRLDTSFASVVLNGALIRLANSFVVILLIIGSGAGELHAGSGVIRGWGHLLSQGSIERALLCILVFAIVTFVVLNRGAMRVAEVSARFALDSLPGKQLLLDSDFRSGLISKSNIKSARQRLIGESQFFAAMDGVMKFIYGESIFTVVSILAIIGNGLYSSWSSGLGWGESLSDSAILAVGFTVAAMIPAIFSTMAVGLRLSKVDIQGESDSESPAASSSQAYALIAVPVVGSLVIFIADQPFFPMLAAVITVITAAKMRRSAEGDYVLQSLSPWGLTKGAANTSLSSLLLFHNSGGDSAERLLADAGRNASGISKSGDVRLIISGVTACEFRARYTLGHISDMNKRVREAVSELAGVCLPDIVMVEDNSEEDGVFRLQVRGVEILVGRVRSGLRFIDLNPNVLQSLQCAFIDTDVHPLKGSHGVWVHPDNFATLSLAKVLGAEICDELSFLILSAYGKVLSSWSQFWGVPETRDYFARDSGVEDLLHAEVLEKGMLSSCELADIIRAVLFERIRLPAPRILLDEVMLAVMSSPLSSPREKWFNKLCDKVVSRVHVYSVRQLERQHGGLRVFTLEPAVEEELRLTMVDGRFEDGGAFDPEFEQSFWEKSSKLFLPVLEKGVYPLVLLCSSELRRGLYLFFSRRIRGAAIFVVGYDELDIGMKIQPVGMISVVRGQ